MMTSVRKTLKTLVWSTQNRSISSDVFPENNHKIRRFFTDCFPTKFVLKIPAKFREIGRFSAILSLKIPRNLTFFSRNLSEALSSVDSVDRSILLAARSIWTDLDTLVQILPLSRFSTHFNSAAPPALEQLLRGPWAYGPNRPVLQWAGILLWCQKLTEHIKIILHPKLERKRTWGRYFMAVWFFNKVVWFVLAAAKTTFCLYLVKRLIVTLRCAVNVTTSSLNHFSRNLGANFVFRKR